MSDRPRARHVRFWLVLAALAGTTSAWAQPSPQFPKRGWGGGASRYSGDVVNPNWYYNWGRTPNPGAFSEFVPMAWGATSVSNPANFQQLLGHSSEYILGFNEPERPDQANMTVARAIELWPLLMSTGKKLVSPAVSDNAEGRAWLSEFMSEVNRLDLRVDAVAFHWYGDVRPANAFNSFLSRVDWYHNNILDKNGNKLPVWVTEFGGVDWTGGADPVTPEMNAQFLAGALPGLDSRPFVQRYAWWNWHPETSLGDGTPFTPSAAGDLYNGRTYSTGQIYSLVGNEGTDTFYLRGGTIQNSGTTKTVRAIDFIQGTSRIQGDGNWDVRNGWLRIRTGATVAKWGTNAINLAGITVYNDGNLFGKTGFLIFSDGTVVEGTGVIRTEWNSDPTPEGITLTESAPGLGGVTINNRIWLNGGQFNIPAGSHALNGELQIASNTTANIAGQLTVSGQMTGPGSFAKSGAGTLRLNAASVNSGAVSIGGGTLVVANDSGSAHGTGTLTIGTNATLAGDGTVGGAGVTLNGTLSPSQASTRPRPMTFAAPLTLGSSARTVMDVGIVLADRVSSASTVSLAGSLELRPTLLPADLVPMTLFSASAITGRFASVTGVVLTNHPGRALAVTYTPAAVTATVTLFGDTNIDGVVDFADLLSLAQGYGTTGRVWAEGDFTGDGEAGFNDLLLLAQNYGAALLGSAGSSTAQPEAFVADWLLARQLVAVPEPSAVLLVALPLGMLLRRRA